MLCTLFNSFSHKENLTSTWKIKTSHGLALLEAYLDIVTHFELNASHIKFG